MQNKRRLVRFIAAFAAFFGLLTVAAPMFGASKEKVLHSFGGNDGANPYAVSLIFDTVGNLYGTTVEGGPSDGGTVFQLVPNGGGTWSEEVLRSFSYDMGNGGALPAAGVILGSDGALYGTTSNNGAYGHGVVFQLTRGTDGKWTEKVLCNFRDPKDGVAPFAVLTVDSAGNLYGTTIAGGSDGYGTVFQLTPGAGGKWTEKALHSFRGTDGRGPFGGLIFDASGNLYGTTSSGGANPGCLKYNASCGTVFQLTPGKDGKWTEKVLHTFGKGNDGATPDGSLILDAAGNLFGTTYYGGNGNGTVFQLAAANGKWTEKVLYSFCSVSGCTDGVNPYSGLVFDSARNLYGTTVVGGAAGDGVVFKLTAAAGGKWSEKVLHSFRGGEDGAYPVGGLTFDATGHLYGTTEGGGMTGNGTVFEITP